MQARRHATWFTRQKKNGVPDNCAKRAKRQQKDNTKERQKQHINSLRIAVATDPNDIAIRICHLVPRGQTTGVLLEVFERIPIGRFVVGSLLHRCFRVGRMMPPFRLACLFFVIGAVREAVRGRAVDVPVLAAVRVHTVAALRMEIRDSPQ